ncbi:phosphoribosylformylglycinamidine synthase-associated small membrane protein [Rhodobium gokarnense]|uniref:Uncharacterized protein n=1 Tax=Rhodobium gokarnense TaxID=364296 RepID=A0ABT3HDB4_9HYPH|nr:phosphoribosylformylglycinamidine synthase-associated small membrane protein [Rhodobium gokarnense]MCW2308368.1 hypothetical protein [Rhodobium gokarnense]
MAEDTPETCTASDDAGAAIRFLAIKAAIFIGIPIVASVIAVVVML